MWLSKLRNMSVGSKRFEQGSTFFWGGLGGEGKVVVAITAALGGMLTPCALLIHFLAASLHCWNVATKDGKGGEEEGGGKGGGGEGEARARKEGRQGQRRGRVQIG